MIYPLAGLVLGAVLGTVQARRKQGNRLDLAQWAAVGALIGGILGLFLLLVLDRAMT